jgi:hypothetical protein
MNRFLRLLATTIAAASLAAGGFALAQPKDKGGKDRQEQRDKGGSDKGGQDKDKKPKKAKHTDGKKLVGDKIKKNGKHELHKNGKHTASVEVQNGKIRGVSVKHAEKGDVPVKKYKTRKKPENMAQASAGGLMPVNLVLAQAYSLGETWIGYAYIDDWGDEVIYWFPYEMIYDGDTGAIEYVPIY